MSSQCKLLLIGIDAATWHVIDPLVRAGELPHLERLIARGASGVLSSLQYSASPVAWTTVATGKWPANHGIQDFHTPQQHLETRRIWEILAAQGEAVGVYHFLVTWPPKPINGFIIPGWLALDDATHPPNLRFIKTFKSNEQHGTNHIRDYVAFVFRALRYGAQPTTLARAAHCVLQRRGWNWLDYRYRAQQIDIALNTEFFCHLLRRYQPTFATIVFYQPDAVGHYYWKYMGPERFPRVDAGLVARYRNVIPDTYRAIDAAVGKILRVAGRDCTVFVVSDHGMGPATHPSTYLYRPKLTDLLEQAGFATDGDHATIGLDFYLNLQDQSRGVRSPEQVLTFLNEMTIAESSEQVFEARLLLEQYVVVRVKAAQPSLKTATIRLPTGETRPYEELVHTREDVSGTHEPEGVLIAAGPGIKAGHVVEHASLVDITPTMLAALGQPVARDMDGSVLTDIFTPAFLRSAIPDYVDSYDVLGDELTENLAPEETEEQKRLIIERLRSFGYLD